MENEMTVEQEDGKNKKNKSAKNIVLDLASIAGVQINGQDPWDIQVHNENFYQRVIDEGALGFGESYMDNWWDCQRLDMLFDRLLRARLDQKVKVPLGYMIKQFLSRFINFQSRSRAKQVAHTHYNLGNDLFSSMLDSRMIYSCAYWKDANTLEDAQLAKLDLICRKLQLKPGMKLLDIGCGWGGLAKYAAEKYGVKVVGVTISQQQCDYAIKYCANLPIEIRLQDYRDINETFDRIVSVGMFEHVGLLNYPVYMKTVRRLLSDDGLFLLHTIGTNESGLMTNEWTSKYIFPNGMLPSIEQIAHSSEKFLVMEDWHNFGEYYDNTLMAWYQNFNQHWDTLKSNYDERFYRMWVYYLLSSAGSFRARSNQLWQVVFSKDGIVGGYTAVR